MKPLPQTTKLILAILIIVVFGIGGWILYPTLFPSEQVPTNINVSQNQNNNTANINAENTNIPPSNLNTLINTSNWKTYRDDELGFEVKYPEELEITENNPTFNFKSDAKDQTNVAFENNQIINDCGCGIYIRVERNEKLFSIDGWLDSDEQKNDNYISQKQYDDKKNSTNETVKLFAGQYNEKIGKINDLSSLRQNYATEGGGYDRILILKNDKIYVITARSDSYYFNKNENQKDGGRLADIFEKMMQNFIVLKD